MQGHMARKCLREIHIQVCQTLLVESKPSVRLAEILFLKVIATRGPRSNGVSTPTMRSAGVSKAEQEKVFLSKKKVSENWEEGRGQWHSGSETSSTLRPACFQEWLWAASD